MFHWVTTIAAAWAVMPPAPLPGAGSQQPPLYFPTTAGARWVYRTGDAERVEVVTAVRQVEGAKVVTVVRVGDGGAVETHRHVRVSQDRLQPCDPDRGVYWAPLLKSPGQPYKVWPASLDSSVSPEGVTRCTFPAEAVTTPAGRFLAIPVQTRRSGEGGSVCLQTEWYAPGVGVVKSDRQGTVTVLKSFSSGGD